MTSQAEVPFFSGSGVEVGEQGPTRYEKNSKQEASDDEQG